MFGDGSSPEERRAGRLQSASILDSVTREIPRFKKDLGLGDQARLDDYLQCLLELIFSFHAVPLFYLSILYKNANSIITRRVSVTV